MKDIPFLVFMAVIILGTVFSVTYFEQQKLLMTKELIAESSTKGIDPMAIRCSFADRNDQICLVDAGKSK